MARRKKDKAPFMRWELVWCKSLQEWVRFVDLLPDGTCTIANHAMGMRPERVPVPSLCRKYVMPTLERLDRNGADRFNAICDEVRQEMQQEKHK